MSLLRSIDKRIIKFPFYLFGTNWIIIQCMCNENGGDWEHVKFLIWQSQKFWPINMGYVYVPE